MSKMKIVLISQDFFPLSGGIARYLMQVYKKYFSKDHFEVIIPEGLVIKEKIDKKIVVHRTPFFPFEINNKKRKEANAKMLKILEDIKPDIILFGYIRSHPEVGIMYKQHNVCKWGLFMHAKEAFLILKNKNNDAGKHLGFNKEELYHYKNIIKEADYIFSVSKFSRNILKKQGINRKVQIINPSIDTSSTKTIKNSKIRLGFSERNLVLLSVGRLIKRKGHVKVIEIMPNLLKKYPEVLYLIVGNGNEMINIKKKISQLNLERNVIIYSNIKDKQLPIFYSACDIFVLPCSYIKPNDLEGFGIVFLEASAYAKPVIGGRTGGVCEGIKNGKTGFLINPNSKRELKNAVIKLLNKKELRKKLGQEGKNMVKNHFNAKYDTRLHKMFKKDSSH